MWLLQLTLLLRDVAAAVAVDVVALVAVNVDTEVAVEVGDVCAQK